MFAKKTLVGKSILMMDTSFCSEKEFKMTPYRMRNFYMIFIILSHSCNN